MDIMFSKNLIIIFIFFVVISSTVTLHADKIEDEILNTAEGFFIALKEKRFADAWELLTVKSKNTIISEVYKDINKTRAKIGKGVVREEFDKKGDLFLIYWNAFVKDFDPSTVLEQSVWNLGEIKDNKAIIILQYKRSDYPAELKIYKEDGKWQFGLVESFWARK
jgi:choline kinase